MKRLSGICALVTASALAASAAASAPGSFTFAFPLPPVGHGSIHEIVLKMKLPAGTTVSGTPFIFHVANGSVFPGYIRAAYAVAAKGSGTWDIFVGINAPTSTKGRRLSSSDETSLDTTLQSNPVPGASFSAKETPGDACPAYLAEFAGVTSLDDFFALVAAKQSEGIEIFGFIRKDDSHCGK
jgi:hypothetical protein